MHIKIKHRNFKSSFWTMFYSVLHFSIVFLGNNHIIVWRLGHEYLVNDANENLHPSIPMTQCCVPVYSTGYYSNCFMYLHNILVVQLARLLRKQTLFDACSISVFSPHIKENIALMRLPHFWKNVNFVNTNLRSTAHLNFICKIANKIFEITVSVMPMVFTFRESHHCDDKHWLNQLSCPDLTQC